MVMRVLSEKTDNEILKLVDVIEENGISNKSYFFKN
jgi:hypothetical protein